MKKRVFIYLTLPLLVLLGACSNGASDDAVGSGSPGRSEAVADVTQSEMWTVELSRAEMTDTLTATLAAIQYGGDILETVSEIVPGAGNSFLLLELTIEKTGVGRASFSWGEAHITDKDGNIYYRHPNDTFLTNLGIPRLKGTDIVLGKESGYICFEIPKDASDLRFRADDGAIDIGIPNGR